MSTRFFFSYREAADQGAALVGGKAWNIGKLSSWGFPLPKGGVLSTAAYTAFLEANQLFGDVEQMMLQLQAPDALENLFSGETEQTELRRKIMQGQIPLEVIQEVVQEFSRLGLGPDSLAVRSSAPAEDSGEASFAGIHVSRLQVKGWTEVETAIKECYASLWTIQALMYRLKRGIVDQVPTMAVVFMEMVEAESAGVAFSCDPHSGRRDQYVINANFGLGESVVNGQVEPDTYVLQADAFQGFPRLISKKIGQKQGLTKAQKDGGTQFVEQPDLAGQQVLSENDLLQLGLLISRVFESLGEGEVHQDLEWVFTGQDFLLVQARPVTALAEYTFPALSELTPVWSNGNYRDSLPNALSPLYRNLIKEAIDAIQYNTFAKVGYPIPSGFAFSRLFQGRLYCNMTALQWAHFDCSGAQPESFNPFWGGHQPNLQLESLVSSSTQSEADKQKRNQESAGFAQKAKENASEIFAGVRAAVAPFTPEYLAGLGDAELVQVYQELGQITRDYGQEFGFLSSVGSLSFLQLIFELGAYFADQSLEIVNGLVVGSDNSITSADQGYRLLELSQIARHDPAARQFIRRDSFEPLEWEKQLSEESPFKQAFRGFIQEFGHRAIYELDIIDPRWAEDPSFLFKTIQSTLEYADLAEWKNQQIAQVKRAQDAVLARVPENRQGGIQEKVLAAQQGFGIREMAKSTMALIVWPYRKLALEMGKRFVQQGRIEQIEDIFFCAWSEVLAILAGVWDGQGLKELVQGKRQIYRKNQALIPPDLIQGDQQKKAEFHPETAPDGGTYLQGVAAVSGKVSGIARLIQDPREVVRFSQGEILIAPSTDSAWTPLFLRAGAIVMETGGFLSHGSIVAREFGIPAVVNVAGVMREIQDGQHISVDGDAGRVYINAKN